MLGQPNELNRNKIYLSYCNRALSIFRILLFVLIKMVSVSLPKNSKYILCLCFSSQLMKDVSHFGRFFIVSMKLIYIIIKFKSTREILEMNTVLTGQGVHLLLLLCTHNFWFKAKISIQKSKDIS